MLTAKIGDSIINCFDGTYDRYRIKQWSNKGILKCPVCGGGYEYCHGEVVSPYFRHIGKECSGYYSEYETDEHRNGKLLLYNWIKDQNGIKNCKLESWIPETKQRPDIYFEFEGKPFVIEFQCTPIASEFLIRRELYKLAGINDIWILGNEKYNIDIDKNGNPFHGKRYKTIEKELKHECIIYFNVKRNLFITNSGMLSMDDELKEIIKKFHFRFKIKKFDLYEKYLFNNDFLFIERLNNFNFDSNKIKLNEEITNLLEVLKISYLNEFERIKDEDNEREEKLKEMKKLLNKIKEKLNIAEKTSDYVGTIGNEITTNALVAEEKYFKTYKSSLYKFVDEKGNILVWMTSTCPFLDIGDFIEITGKVKSHSEYENIKQTRLIRCKVGIKVR